MRKGWRLYNTRFGGIKAAMYFGKLLQNITTLDIHYNWTVLATAL